MHIRTNTLVIGCLLMISMLAISCNHERWGQVGVALKNATLDDPGIQRNIETVSNKSGEIANTAAQQVDEFYQRNRFSP